MLEQFSIQPIFEYPCDRGAINGDSSPLEPFRVGDKRSVRMCEVPEVVSG